MLRYITNYYNAARDSFRFRHTPRAPNVGWIGDPLPRLMKFERWKKRPRKAHQLYWRLHGIKH